MSRPVHFEIHADDPQRAMAFYRKLLGWSFKAFEGGPMPYWLVTTGPDSQPGINGGLHPRIGAKPVPDQAVIGYVCTVPVDNVDVFVKKVTELGGTICVPKMPIPGMGWLAYAQDTEKNIFGMMQMDETAK
jgi:predicted enzyme related to lactoylglutathione lyase